MWQLEFCQKHKIIHVHIAIANKWASHWARFWLSYAQRCQWTGSTLRILSALYRKRQSIHNDVDISHTRACGSGNESVLHGPLTVRFSLTFYWFHNAYSPLSAVRSTWALKPSRHPNLQQCNRISIYHAQFILKYTIHCWKNGRSNKTDNLYHPWAYDTHINLLK